MRIQSRTRGSSELLCAGYLGQMGRNEDGEKQMDSKNLKVEISALNCEIMTSVGGLYMSCGLQLHWFCEGGGGPRMTPRILA